METNVEQLKLQHSKINEYMRINSFDRGKVFDLLLIDDTTLISCSQHNNIEIWDMCTLNLIQKKLFCYDSELISLDLTFNGDLTVLSDDNELFILERVTWRLLKKLNLKYGPSCTKLLSNDLILQGNT